MTSEFETGKARAENGPHRRGEEILFDFRGFQVYYLDNRGRKSAHSFAAIRPRDMGHKGR